MSLEEQEDLARLGFPEQAVVELSGGLGRELEDLLSALGQPV